MTDSDPVSEVNPGQTKAEPPAKNPVGRPKKAPTPGKQVTPAVNANKTVPKAADPNFPSLQTAEYGPFDPSTSIHSADSIWCSHWRLWDARSRSRVWLEFSELQKAHEIEHEFLTRKDVILAIAAVLVGRRQDIVDFAFGPSELFDVRTKEDVEKLDKAIVPVGSGDDLIIPIMLDDTDPKTGKSSATAGPGIPAMHARVAFVVASIDRNSKLWIRYYCSDYRGGHTPGGFFQGVAKAIIARWDRLGQNPQSYLDACGEEHIACPGAMHQNDHDTSRLQLVLNAWAHIFDDPVQPGAPWAVNQIDNPFFACTREMVRALRLEEEHRSRRLHRSRLLSTDACRRLHFAELARSQTTS